MAAEFEPAPPDASRAPSLRCHDPRRVFKFRGGKRVDTSPSLEPDYQIGFLLIGTTIAGCWGKGPRACGLQRFFIQVGTIRILNGSLLHLAIEANQGMDDDLRHRRSVACCRLWHRLT